jgi:N-acetylglutamate synthase-like GNAT family acetyltransferase
MGQVLTVRTARPADLAEIDALLARSYPRLLKGDYPPSVMVTAVPLIARARPGLLAGGTYYLAEGEDGQVLGVGGWSPRGRGRDGLFWGEVRQVATDDRFTRRGVGRAILGHVFAEARAAGIGVLDCLATRTAVPFYRSMGFERLDEATIPIALAIGFPAVRMRRRM